MNSKIKLLVAGIALSLASQGAWASSLTFDFTQLLNGTGYSTSYSPGHSATVNGITASAYYYDASAGTWKDANLWVRNEAPNDLGLGVCSPGESNCSPSYYGLSGNGDSNELSQATNQEVIVMERPAGYAWSDLVVSSLDSGGTNGAEAGTLYWSSDSMADINTFLNNTLAGSNSASFSYGTGGAANNEIDTNGNVLALNNASSFDPNAKYAVFTSGAGSQVSSGMLGDGGSTTSTSCSYTWTKWGKKKTCTTTSTPPLNNDYLVWSGALNSVPEPGTLALMGLGLVGLYAGRRKAAKR